MIHYDVPDDEWPTYDFNEIFKGREKMLLSELKNVYTGAKLKDDRLYEIRANYGMGIIAGYRYIVDLLAPDVIAIPNIIIDESAISSSKCVHGRL